MRRSEWKRTLVALVAWPVSPQSYRGPAFIVAELNAAEGRTRVESARLGIQPKSASRRPRD